MEQYQQEFIEFLAETGALRFGTFTLKSGRKSPYFFNSGMFNDGAAIRRLGYYYACAVRELEPTPTSLFGPAYKGIPLCVSAAIALEEHFGISLGYCFDRKEAKGHGDKGLLVGKTPEAGDRIAIIDDVITDGATKVEAIRRLNEISDAPVTSLIIAVNRQEQNAKGEDPIGQLAASAGIEVRSIVTIRDILEHLHNRPVNGQVLLDDEAAEAIKSYLEQYGV
jgi:orotate phosphoribosyltransferase